MSVSVVVDGYGDKYCTSIHHVKSENEINFVGPRPSLISQQKLIKQRDNKKILSIKPGLTGYSQINHIDMSDIDKLVDFDHYYLINQSLFFDLKIIMKTFLGIGFKDNVNK